MLLCLLDKVKAVWSSGRGGDAIDLLVKASVGSFDYSNGERESKGRVAPQPLSQGISNEA